MKVLLTGMNGTVAPVVAERLTDAGHAVVGWDRAQVPIDDLVAVRSFFDGERPAFCFHLATGPAEWAEAIAAECAERRIGLLYTSSVSVFSGKVRGPLLPHTVPDAVDEYGRYKIDCERRVQRVCPRAVIVRLGWQIGSAPGSNNMVDYFQREVGADTRLEVSRRWFPACSLLQDTAECLCTHFETLGPGVHHLDANPGLSLYEIAVNICRVQGWDWHVLPTDEPDQNNLMEDERLRIRPITEHFARLHT